MNVQQCVQKYERRELNEISVEHSLTRYNIGENRHLNMCVKTK